MKKAKTLSCAATVLLLAACGGGESGTRSTDTPPPSISGSWDGEGVSLLATSSGEVLGIELDLDLGNRGVIKGAMTTDGDGFTATWTAYHGAEKTHTLASGTFVEKQKISGSRKGLVTESGTKPMALQYDVSYDRSPSLASLKGSYNWIGGPGEAGFSIAENGVISTIFGDCSMSGQISPDLSGKNFYRLTMIYGPEAACDVPGGTAEGFLLPPRSQGDGNASSGGVPGPTLLVGGMISGNTGRSLLLYQMD